MCGVCVGDADPGSVSQRIAAWGVELVAVPPAAAAGCAAAYASYRARRKADSGKDAPAVPLPDFSSARTPKSWAGRLPPAMPRVSRLPSPPSES
ncbi:MAG: hypothetical protein O2960_03035 [Verrucomicrobia bacterium]|nr:hypothetical protein [Verrucomicrobiota bacterium]